MVSGRAQHVSCPAAGPSFDCRTSGLHHCAGFRCDASAWLVPYVRGHSAISCTDVAIYQNTLCGVTLQASVPSAVLGLTWASKSLLLAVPGGYSALTPASQQPTAAAAGNSSGMTYHLTVLADHLHDISPMLGCVPDLGLGLMLWEQNMVLVTDATGRSAEGPLMVLAYPWLR